MPSVVELKRKGQTGLLFLYLNLLESEEDRSKFAKLYMQYREMMFYTALQVLRNDMDAEDAVHQSFLAILKHFSKIRNFDLPETRAYVIVVTRRKAIDILRAESRLEDMGADVPDNYQLFEQNDIVLADAMQSLPERCREALLLRYLHGYSIAELASLWGIKKGSVYTIMWRAKKALAKRLEENVNEQ